VGSVQLPRVYRGPYASGSPVGVIANGGGACAAAAAAFLLLL
jgi:hypothetical protein